MTPKLSILLGCLLIAFWGCDLNQGPLSEAVGMYDRAVSLYEDNSFRQAETLFVQTLPIFDRQGDIYRVAEANRYLGHIYFAEGKLHRALKRFETALGKTKETKDFRSEMHIHALIGDVYYAMGQYNQANGSYNAARQLSSAFNDAGVKGELETKLGMASYFAGRLGEALREYQSALSYYQTNSENVAAASLLGRISELYIRQGKTEEAINFIAQARTLIEKMNEPALEARLRMTLGLAYKAQHNLNEALQQFRDAVNNLRSKRAAREYETLLLFQIGNVYYDNGRFADAKRYFTEGEALARTSGDWLSEGYQQLFGVRCDERLIPATNRLQSAERIAKAYAEIAQRFQDAGHRTGETYCYAQTGRLYESVGNSTKAQEQYRKALQLYESVPAEFLKPDLHRPYQEQLKVDHGPSQWATQLAGLLIQANKSQEALALVERNSSQSFFDLFEDVAFASRHPELKEKLAFARSKFIELKMIQIELSSLLSIRGETHDAESVNSLRTRIQELSREVSEISQQIVGQYPNYEPLLQLSTIKLQEIQSSIPRGTLVLRFLPAEDQFFIFALSRSKFEVKSVIVTKEKLFALVNEYRRLLHDPSVYTGTGGEESVPAMTRFATLSTQLYDYFIRPVDGLLERNLVIIMSPEFENFPFQTIERQDRKGAVQYLIEITSVDFLPSLASFRFKVATSSRINQIVALGNPSGKNWSIDYELRDIRSFYKDAKIFISREATWGNLSAAKADALQLSTDFIIGEGISPLGTFAVTNVQLTGEASRLPFDKLSELSASPVVVLSNQYGQGFGLIPAHALLLRINGTSDVFLNAWFADRKAAKFFSEFFYTHLSDGLAPGDAFRQALLNLIRTKDVNHPHSWGQFFHFGVG